MLEVLTGSGLALAAGLNAYVPLLVLGLLGRYTDLLPLPEQWAWLENGWVLTARAILLLVDVVADKVPSLDHLHDVAQTLVSPTAGGVACAAGVGSRALTGTDEHIVTATLAPFLCGLVIALVTHLAKSAVRAVVALSTAGLGGPIVSTLEDVSTLALVIFAVAAPVLVLVFVAALVLVLSRFARRGHRADQPHEQERACG